ncbi:MAG: beta-N-acetylglucosaminidase domain-containing protein [Asticcacaulis sp.]
MVSLALGAASAHAVSLPVAPAVFPTPTSVRLTGPEIAIGRTVVLVRAGTVDSATEALVRRVLTEAGVETIRTATRLPAQLDASYVVIGTADADTVKAATTRIGATLPTQTEGYTLASQAENGAALIVLAGKDSDGLYHGVQTLRQIAVNGHIPALTIADHPAMPVRGTIEGFYGKPWSMAERAAHIEFLAGMKANTYIYSPKDEVYARDKWRDPYPADMLKEMGTLVDVANSHHINFVYAISPGPSICYSDPADLQTLLRKFKALRGIGVRSFYVALDDIEYKTWNCPADEAAFGAPGETAAAHAQAQLLNAVQADLDAAGHGALFIVPTEYYNNTVSPYKTVLAKELDPRVEIQWTGTDVVPASISVADARSATRAFGRKTLLWDNYPVNDYKESTGRLLLGPYTRREAGLSTELTGIVSNPMNQEVASRPAVMGLVAFAWNDTGYDAERTWRAAARYLAGGDTQVTQALLTFFDTQTLAPTFGNLPWQPQAPRLRVLTNRVRDALGTGDAVEQTAALEALGQAADDLAAAPDRIRAGVVIPGFVTEAEPWLEATSVWGRALRLTVDGLRADNAATAARLFAEAQRLADEAGKFQTIPGATRFMGSIRIADGVLDTFIKDAPTLVYAPSR